MIVTAIATVVIVTIFADVLAMVVFAFHRRRAGVVVGDDDEYGDYDEHDDGDDDCDDELWYS